jgi:hypothetical protein
MTYRPQQQPFLLEVLCGGLVEWEHDNDCPDPPLPPPPPTAEELKRLKRQERRTQQQQHHQQQGNSTAGGGVDALRNDNGDDGDAAMLAAQRWVLQEEQHFDVEDEGRAVQMLHREVAYLLKEVAAVRADMGRMEQKVEALRAAQQQAGGY